MKANSARSAKEKAHACGSAFETPAVTNVTDEHGRNKGRKKKSVSVVYEDPPVDGLTRWDSINVSPRSPNAALNVTGHGARVLNAQVFPEDESAAKLQNEDKDCFDRVTRQRFGGTGVIDGAPLSCFALDGSLNRTLYAVSGGCVHTSGALFSGTAGDTIEDDCYDATGALKTALEQIVDEDASESGDDDGDGLINEDPAGDSNGDGNPNDDGDCLTASGESVRGSSCVDSAGALSARYRWLVDEDGNKPIDQDGDGQFDEDPANRTTAQMDDRCGFFGDVLGLDDVGGVAGPGRCTLSLTDAIAAVGNRKAKEVYDRESRGRSFENPFRVGADGKCDAASIKGEVACGKESRRQTVEEEVILKCHGNAEYVDGGCRKPLPTPPVADDALLGLGGPSDQVIDKQPVLMGFTLAPPSIEWGVRVSQDACIDLWFTEICFEVFSARVGYEFDFDAGFRLPVEVTIDRPGDVLAGTSPTLKSNIEPVDFTVGDYKTFCNKHHLGGTSTIASCDEFAFPEWLDSKNPFTSGDAKDGSELALAATAFAGVQVKVFTIPIINFAIDFDADIAKFCTLWKLKEGLSAGIAPGLFANLSDGFDGDDLLNALKDQGLVCGSFTTPFGSDQDGNLRTFPFSATPLEIEADCATEMVKASATGAVVGGKSEPMCTGLILGPPGANMGVGLEVGIQAGSNLIEANWTTEGDARGSGRLRYIHNLSTGVTKTVGFRPTFDNFQPGHNASITLDDFTYYLNTLRIALTAKVGFGGVLEALGDLFEIPLLTITAGAGSFGIPIGQHAGSEPITLTIPVENYALSLSVGAPIEADSLSVVPGEPSGLKIRPGTTGVFQVVVNNRGSRADSFNNFRLSLPPNWKTGVDRVAPSDWLVSDVAADTSAARPLTIAPYRHFSTAPGRYPMTLLADSVKSREKSLAALDGSNQTRYDAAGELFVEVIGYHEPRLSVAIASQRAIPGGALNYGLHTENHGNVADTIGLARVTRDSNTANCDLADRGRGRAGCAYRAQVTRLPLEWTTLSTLPASFLDMAPGGMDAQSFNIQSPPAWAGMEDTLYEVAFTGTVTEDVHAPRATAEALARLTVIATSESRTRYIALEIEDVIARITDAQAGGLKVGGLLPVMLHPARLSTQRALESILAGNKGAMSKSLGTTVQAMTAFKQMLTKSSLPAAMVADWSRRGDAILVDLASTQALAR